MDNPDILDRLNDIKITIQRVHDSMIETIKTAVRDLILAAIMLIYVIPFLIWIIIKFVSGFFH